MPPAPHSWPPQNAPQQRTISWPPQNVPQQRTISWSPQNAPQQGAAFWPTQVLPQPGPTSLPNPEPPQPGIDSWVPEHHFNMPEALPEPAVHAARRPKPKWLGTVAWSLWLFAGGLAAGPLLDPFVDRGVEASVAWLASWAPSFLRPYLPRPLEAPTPLPSRASVARPVAANPPTTPRAPTVETLSRPAASAAAAVRPSPKTAAAVVKVKPAPVERPAIAARTRAVHGKRAKVEAALAAADATAPAVAPKSTGARRERGNPFDDEGSGAAEPATERPAKAAPTPAKSAGTSSGDGLDDLMNGVVGGGGNKPGVKRNTSKEIDAMLKDVQKSEPAPKPKQAEPAPLPPLTAAEIAKVMAGVKTRADGCGRRFGQNGVVDLRLAVGTDGRVNDVALRGKLADSPVAQCVAQAARGATFPRNAGLKFDYRINVQ